MELSLLQQVLVGGALWMFIGTLVSVNFILNHMTEDDTTEEWASFIGRTQFMWPQHVLILLGLKIISIMRSSEDGQ